MGKAIDNFLNQSNQNSDDSPPDARDAFLESAVQDVQPQQGENQALVPSELSQYGVTPEDISGTAIEETERDMSRGPADARDQFLANAGQGLDARDKFLKSTEAYTKEQEPGMLKTMGQGLLKGLVALGEMYESVSVAPTKSAIQAGLRGENPAAAFWEQFTEDPSKAPAGKDIASQDLGLSREESTIPEWLRESVIGQEPGQIKRDPKTGKSYLGEPKERAPLKISPAGAVGFALDVLPDPFMLLPVGKLTKGAAKLAGKGIKETARTALKGSAAAADFALDTAKFTETKQLIGRSIDDVMDKLKTLFDPKIADDFDKYEKIALKNNIDIDPIKESIEFSKESFLSKAIRQRRELGGASAERFKEGVKQIGNSIRNKIKEIGATGDVLDNVSAGKLIRDSYDRGVAKFFDSMDVTHNTVMKNNPGLKLSDEAMAHLESKLRGIERFAKGRIKRGADPIFVSQGRRLLKNIENIRKTNGSYKQMVEALREIGEISYLSKNTMATIPADVDRMRKIYKVLNESLIDTVEKSAIVKRGDEIIKGGELANNLILNNARMTEHFSNKSVLKRIGDKNLSDEALFKNIITSGDSKKIEALKNIISIEDFNQLKASFLNDILKVNQEGNVLFRSTFNSLDRKKAITDKLLSTKEVEEFSELLGLGDRVGIPVLSTSGTGASNVISEITKNIGNVISNDLLIENLKKSARTKAQVEALSKLPEIYGKNQAIAVIREAKYPAKVERAAINRIRKVPALFADKILRVRPVVKAPQVISAVKRKEEKRKRALQRK